MSKLDVLAREFSAATRQAGAELLRTGSVKVRPSEFDGSMRVRVMDKGAAFECTITPQEEELGVVCHCDDWQAGANCSHVWASLLAVEDMISFAVDDELDDAQDPPFSDTMPGLFGASYAWSRPQAQHRPRRRRSPAWKRLIDSLDEQDSPSSTDQSSEAVLPIYVIEARRIHGHKTIPISTYRRAMRQNGKAGKLRDFPLGLATLYRVRNPADRIICAHLSSTGQMGGHYYGGFGPNRLNQWNIDAASLRTLLPQFSETGRLMFRRSDKDEPGSLPIETGAPWELALVMRAKDDGYEMVGEIVRAGTRRPISDASLLCGGDPGFCIVDGTLFGLDTFGCEISAFMTHVTKTIPVSRREAERVVKALQSLSRSPRLELPDPWSLEVLRDVVPTGQVELTIEKDRVNADVSFRYGDVVVPGLRRGRILTDAAGKRQLLRNRAAEGGLKEHLRRSGFKEEPWQTYGYSLPLKRLPDVVRDLSAAGWTVLADGRAFRRAGDIDIEITSGIDWFDLNGKVDFDGLSVGLPELLRALRGGRQFVQLGDGSLGMLPEEWLRKHGVMLELGQLEGDKLRFGRTQALLLDAMLAEQRHVRVDTIFAGLRDRLRAFDGVRPVSSAPAFVGTLRPYQEQGLGWLRFLDEFGWGGCLADDMGLGKTVQVLAWLATRAAGGGERDNSPADGGRSLPSLVVAPRSVVFNWLDEARRFTPGLRVMAYHGSDRHGTLDRLNQHDLIVTTYHTLRNDIADFSNREFAYVILDEAQSIKNAQAQIAKAVRLMKAHRRLALTGTPVENHLGDLWSLFEFLNPGMLGAVSAFKSAFSSNGNGQSPQIETLRRAVRPFMLRRTKEAVAPELPSKIEETIHCEMTVEQSRRYDELRQYYRASVLGKVAEIGLARSKIHVLEALLRLRQAACHPRLLDKSVADTDSGKTEALLPMLLEAVESGHKVLVFSQFTSFLAIVKPMLDRENLTYEYLDGKTRDRKERVHRFQNDEKCRLFLISLKAGGLGLNLTAADYVFILDPWWNPAVEAQAIDRTHRIGQDKKVIAYRLISKGTVEEKILSLQSKKRDLATSIITEANSLISELSREDLEVLLS